MTQSKRKIEREGEREAHTALVITHFTVLTFITKVVIHGTIYSLDDSS
jgi:hypothetical protein